MYSNLRTKTRTQFYLLLLFFSMTIWFLGSCNYMIYTFFILPFKLSLFKKPALKYGKDPFKKDCHDSWAYFKIFFFSTNRHKESQTNIWFGTFLASWFYKTTFKDNSNCGQNVEKQVSYTSIKRRIKSHNSLGKRCGNMLHDCKHTHIIYPSKFQNLFLNIKIKKWYKC